VNISSGGFSSSNEVVCGILAMTTDIHCSLLIRPQHISDLFLPSTPFHLSHISLLPYTTETRRLLFDTILIIPRARGVVLYASARPLDIETTSRASFQLQLFILFVFLLSFVFYSSPFFGVSFLRALLCFVCVRLRNFQ
jgi:hypothetical protein